MIDFLLKWFTKGRALLALAPDALAFGLAAQVYFAKHVKDPEAQALLNTATRLVEKAEAIVSVPTGTGSDHE